MQINTSTLSLSILWIVVLMVGLSVIHIYKESIESMNRTKKRNRDNHGLPVGTRFPRVEFNDIHGNLVKLIDQNDNRERLLILTSLGCSVCEQLYPFIVPFQKANSFMKVLWLVSGERNEVKKKLVQYANDVSIIYIAPDELLGYTKKLPFTYYLSKDGIIRARDVTTEESHFIELFKKYA